MGIIQRIVERVHAERPSAEEWRELFVAYSKHVIDMREQIRWACSPYKRIRLAHCAQTSWTISPPS